MSDSPTPIALPLDPLQLQTIIDSSSDCIKVLDLDAHLLSMNAGGMEIMEVTNFSSCQFLLWPTFWEGDARLQVEQALQAAREGHTSTFEGPARTLAGTPKWWEVRVSPLRDTGGTITQLLAISRDVTARKTAEQQLQASESRLRERASTLEVQVSQNEQALDAFVRFTTEVASSTDLTVLASAALNILRDVLSDAMSGFYLIRGDTAFPLIFSSNTPPEVQSVQQGLLLQSPLVAQAFRARRVTFAEQDQRLHPWVGYATALSVTPYMRSDRPYALLVTGTDRLSWTAQERAILQSVGRGLGLALERAQQTQQLQERTAGLDAFVAFTEAVGTETDLLALAQQAIALLRGRFDDGSIGYYTPDGDLWKARAWSEDMDEALIARLRAGLPSSTHFIRDSLKTGRPVFTDTWDAQQEEIEDTEAYGAAAAYPLRVDGEVRHLLLCGLKGTQRWTERDRALVRAVGRSLALAVDRAEQTRQVEEERAALAAFARFTEQSTHTTDVLTLAERARDVLRDTLGVQVGYSELEDGLWKGRVFSENAPVEVREQARVGFPADLPSFARPFEEREVVFVDGWDPQGAASTEVYGAAAFYPYFEGGQPSGLLTMGTSEARIWTERERLVFRSVGRSLALAFERAEEARRLALHNAELDARTRALEAFAELTRDLTLHDEPYTLIERAQQLVLSLLPDGYALYFEPEAARWVLRAQTGELRSAALQAVADSGLPYHEAANLLIPYTTHAPYYQDEYDQDTDQIAELVAHLGASATFPLLVDGRPRGVFAVVLFGTRRPWTRAEKAVMESVTRSLSLALESIEARRNLNRTQHYLKVAANHAPILLFVTDARGVFTLSEGSLLAKLGLQAGQAVGHQATAMFAHEPELREGRRLNRALAGEDAHDLMHFSAQDMTLETWFIPVKNPVGEVTEVVGVSLDVTERLNGQRDLEQANEELRRSNAELEQFAYIASHDLQAPIRAVTSFAGIIDKRYGEQLDERGRLYLRQIVEGGEHMKRLVDDLLAFSRLHTEKGELLPVNAEAVFDAVARRLQGEGFGTSLTRGELPVVQADAQQLDQLLQNLVANGLKYRRADMAPHVHVSAERTGVFWRFAVSDNGIGIEPQYFERIFEIFQRLHGRESYEGTGIGLAVCKKIVERHGGRLWLESTPGEGSTFFFTLPEA